MAIVVNDVPVTTNTWTLNGTTRIRSLYERKGFKQVPFVRSAAQPQLEYYRRESKISGYAIKRRAYNQNPSQIYLPSHFDSPVYTTVMSNYIDLYGAVNGDVAKLAYNKAYDRFVKALKTDTASLGVSVAEGRDCLEMIAKRAIALGNGYKELRRGNFRGFLKTFDLRPLSKHKKTRWTRPKDASGIWLEYWLGWAPFVGDIQNSISVLTDTKPYPDAFFRASARVVLPASLYRDAGTSRYLSEGVEGFVRCSLGSRVRVTNQNTWLNNRIGLVDWVGMGYAVIPFSFIVSWFVNLDKIIASYTNFAGLELVDSWVSCLSSATGSFEYTSWDSAVAPKERYVISCDESSANLMRRVKVTNLPRPSLVVQLPDLNPARAATAISLLVSIFTKG